MANDLIPFKEDANRVTCTPTAAVQGKRFVSISGDRNADGTYSIAPTAAGGKAFGVACWDAPVGGKVTVVVIESGHIVPVVASAVIAANASVTAAADARGVTAAAAASAVGICLTGAAAGADAQVLLTRHTA